MTDPEAPAATMRIEVVPLGVGINAMVSAVPVQLRPGMKYDLAFRARRASTTTQVTAGFWSFSGKYAKAYGDMTLLSYTDPLIYDTQFADYRFRFETPAPLPADVRLVVYALGGPWTVDHTPVVYLSSFTLYSVDMTMADRRGFERSHVLQAGSAIDATAAAYIGDAWLATHLTQPFQGQFPARFGDVTRHPGGDPVPASALLDEYGSLVQIPTVDPDTGALGRVSRIAAVTYDADTDTATVTLDELTGNFEALARRMEGVQG